MNLGHFLSEDTENYQTLIPKELQDNEEKFLIKSIDHSMCSKQLTLINTGNMTNQKFKGVYDGREYNECLPTFSMINMSEWLLKLANL